MRTVSIHSAVRAVLGGQSAQYVYNAQGDVVMLLGDRGYVLAEYTYDAWGNITVTGDAALAKQNPFTYRGAYGYYYDWETGLYYLQSRYYDPQVCRFVNADGQLNGGVLGSNLFAYCENCSTSYTDPTGYKTDKGMGSFGLRYYHQLPTGFYTSRLIKGAGSVPAWAVASDFKSIADDHCGQTAITNLALYFAARGYSCLKVNNSVWSTFRAVLSKIGDGMTTALQSNTKRYFKSRGITAKSSNAGSESAIMRAIDNNRPVSLLLCQSLFEWHWVICVGYRRYKNGEVYFRVVSGWNNSFERYYKLNSGSKFVSGSQYWI